MVVVKEDEFFFLLGLVGRYRKFFMKLLFMLLYVNKIKNEIYKDKCG